RIRPRPGGRPAPRSRTRCGCDDPREPLRARRQGRGHGGRVVRPLRRRTTAVMTVPSLSVAARIAQNRDDGRGSLIGYLPVGFPDLGTSIDAAIALAENGVDALELGLPYSDPVMDGLAIQKATEAAIANGFRVRDVFT